jgi:hypothetical protein
MAQLWLPHVALNILFSGGIPLFAPTPLQGFWIHKAMYDATLLPHSIIYVI